MFAFYTGSDSISQSYLTALAPLQTTPYVLWDVTAKAFTFPGIPSAGAVYLNVGTTMSTVSSWGAANYPIFTGTGMSVFSIGNAPLSTANSFTVGFVLTNIVSGAALTVTRLPTHTVPLLTSIGVGVTLG
jgi:hypothetical protein